MQGMEFVVERSDFVHAPAHPWIARRHSGSRNNANDLGKQFVIMNPVAPPELFVAKDHFRFQIFHATKIDETDGPILVEKIIAGMRISMKRFHAEKLEKEEVG